MKGLEFACEKEKSIAPIVKERFYSSPIPDNCYSLFLFIINDNGEHANKSFHTINSPICIRMKNNLCIRVSRKVMSTLDQFFPDFLIIIYLSIKHDRKMIIRHWLVTSCGNVDY